MDLAFQIGLELPFAILSTLIAIRILGVRRSWVALIEAGAIGWITGNLLGPLVINTVARLGVQVVLTEKKWTCRQPLLQLPADVRAATAVVATVTPKRAAA